MKIWFLRQVFLLFLFLNLKVLLYKTKKVKKTRQSQNHFLVEVKFLYLRIPLYKDNF